MIHITDFRIKKIMGDPAVADLGQAVVERITSPLGLVIYMGGIIALGLHLRHALQSAFQTLGLSHPRYADNVRYVSAASAALITLGFAAIPLYLLFTGQGASS